MPENRSPLIDVLTRLYQQTGMDVEKMEQILKSDLNSPEDTFPITREMRLTIALAFLPRKDRALVVGYYSERKTLPELANKLNMGTNRARNIFSSAMAFLCVFATCAEDDVKNFLRTVRQE